MQEDEGVDSVEVDDLQEYFPASTRRASRTRSTSPTRASPIRSPTTRAYIEAARRAGAEARRGTPVEAARGDAVRGVRVGGELLECDNVVLAAGPWSMKLAARVGLELPLEITARAGRRLRTGGAPSPAHAISSQVDRVYMRPRPSDGRFLAGRGYPKDYELVDPDALRRDGRRGVRGRRPRRACRRGCRGSRACGASAARVGLYDVTPDWHPLLGPVDGYEGLFLATGGSGHCFKLGPAIGELVAGALGCSATRRRRHVLALAVRRGPRARLGYGGNRA